MTMKEFGFGADIDALLRGILDDAPIPTVQKLVVENTLSSAAERGVTQLQAVQAVKQFAAEQMDPELYEDAEVAEAKVTPQSNDEPIFTDSEIDTTRVPMPVFTTAEIMDRIDIRSFATLVTLQTSRWHAKVKDRQASKDAATTAGADAAAFETRKRLLVGADELLKKIHQSIDVARTAHYQMTLPWSMKGMEDQGKRIGGRLLPNTLFMEYTTVMAKAKSDMDAALDAFVPAYPGLIKVAQSKLGTRFDPREYPNVSAIRTHFGLSFDFQPIPAGDDFKGLAATQCEALADALNRRTATMLENAMQDAWVRLHEVVSHAAERFSSPDKMFHYTLVEKLRDTVKLLKHLNVTGDKRIEYVRKFVEKNLTMHGVTEIKEDAALRKQLGAAAHHALNMMKEMP